MTKLIPALPLVLAAAVACESLSNLDDVAMAPAAGGASSDAAPDHLEDAPPADAGDDQHAGDAEPADSGSAFPATCIKPGSVMIQCDPMTNAGCAEGTACDLAKNEQGYGLVCFPTGTVDEGGACNGVSGPWCKPTLHCGTNTCVKFCCTSAECPGGSCGMYDPATVGTFGWCQ